MLGLYIKEYREKGDKLIIWYPERAVSTMYEKSALKAKGPELLHKKREHNERDRNVLRGIER